MPCASRFAGRRTLGLAACIVLSSGCAPEAEQQPLDKLVAEMTQRVEMTTQAETRDGLIPRYNQPKTVACVNASFEVHDGLPDTLRHGLFAMPGRYPARLRFANATKWDDAEKDLRGLSIRVKDLPGEPIWGEAGQQDFLLNSHPALFVATPEEFLAFMRARQEGGVLAMLKFFFNPFDPHIRALRSVLAARDHHASPLDIRYWSTVPFALGSTARGHVGNGVPAMTDVSAAERPTAVKYSVTPCSTHTTDKPVAPGENQLRAALKAHLEQAPGCFHFGVQVQGDPEQMPIEDAAVIWDEKDAPFQTVATISFEKQPFDAPGALAACERATFNPWQSLPEHAPLGRMNAVRAEIYATGADVRLAR